MTEQSLLDRIQEAIKSAKDLVEEKLDGYAYPIFETDDDGNTIDEDVGMVPWGSCNYVDILDAECVDHSDDQYTINVDVEWEWEEKDKITESGMAILKVIVFEENGKLYCDDWERID